MAAISGGYAELNKVTEMIKVSSIIVAAVPMLIIYPFVQTYFEKGFDLVVDDVHEHKPVF